MSDNTSHTKAILKRDPSFPDHLDFDTLRREGIKYVAELSGKIWTDHNVHDPGITILELLCYAMIDLGYRTSLPAVDILSRPPLDKTPDDNFFTPAQILTCNPVTITDFRKLLIDIKEVKNAWLEIAEWQIDCGSTQTGAQSPLYRDPVEQACGIEPCRPFLNGLYQVYIELYKGPYGKKSKKEETAINEVIEKVRSVLMAHRNFCEDFVTINVLCKEKIGVCANIELTADADAEKVYQKVVETLKAFFSPDPTYYTLPELIEKKKPITDIFAGRPFLQESHGFVDTEELEAIPFRKEIHLSDVYNALFKIEGISSVRKLSLSPCGEGKKTMDLCKWKYLLEKDHVPEFSLDCSQFNFTRNGMPLQVNDKKFKDLFNLNFSFAGKILYQEQLPYLDSAVPQGIYRNDLAEYHSIINELPRVYGVSEGGLPDGAAPARKAQALQLKGYLLFFDQLLANYLTQLSNIRSLFSLAGNKEKGQTYFVNKPLNVPDLQQLLRFGDGTDSQIALGKQGSIQAIPVDRSFLEEAAKKNEWWAIDLESIQPKDFLTASNRDIAVYQAMEDLQNKNFTLYTAMNHVTDCWLFYIYTHSDEVAFVSNRYYATQKDAETAAANVAYVGTFKENFRKHIVPKNENGNGGPLSTDPRFSFDIELNMAGYFDYLQQIVEDKTLYQERRRSFLDHLLARFSESFTDFAMLSYDSLQAQELAIQDLHQKGNFLAKYDTISRNRGKGYDYKLDGWNNENISGFENRVLSLAGVEDHSRHSLCHFEVKEYAQQFFWTLQVGDNNAQSFKSTGFFDSTIEAKADLKAFIAALKNEASYKTAPVPLHDAHEIIVHYNNEKIAYPVWQSTAEAAEATRLLLYRAFSGNPIVEKDIFVSHEIYKTELRNNEGKIVRRMQLTAETANKSLSAARPLVKKINEEDWTSIEEKAENRPALELRAEKMNPRRLIDITSFHKKIVTCPDEYRWHLHNEQGELILKSHHTWASPQEAIAGMIAVLTEQDITPSSFKPWEKEAFFFFDLLANDGNMIATAASFNTAEEREQAIAWLQEFCSKEKADEQYTYPLKDACRWNVQFGDIATFESVAVLADPENAINTWRKDKTHFRNAANYFTEKDPQEKLTLFIKDDRNGTIARIVSGQEQSIETLFENIQAALQKNTFKASTQKVESGFSFRIRDAKGQVLLSGYEVYESRGAALFAMLRAFEKAEQENMYLKSGDEGNREFTFFLKNDDRQFLAEHPAIYDADTERDKVFAETLEFFKASMQPVRSVKDPVQYTFEVNYNNKQLLHSTQQFKNTREADEAAVQVLMQAAMPGNWQLVKDADKDPYEVRLITGDQHLAAAPEKFATVSLANVIRDRIMHTITPHIYTLEANPFPDKWRFHYNIGLHEADSANFTSNQEYNSETEAVDAWKKMAADLGSLQIQSSGAGLQLAGKQKNSKINLTATDAPQVTKRSAITADPVKTAETRLTNLQRLRKIAVDENEKAFDKFIKMDELTQQGTWVYRLVKKDAFFAWHREFGLKNNLDLPEERIKKMYEALRNPLHYLEVCQGGDITCVRKDTAGNAWYHYQVQARNLYYDAVNKEELVLFTSCVGYESREAAEKAFTENYLIILKRASTAVNYGAGKFISLVPVFFKPGEQRTHAGDPVVYIPTKTISYFGDAAQATDKLVKLAKSYPVRLIGKNHYRFRLYDYETQCTHFISAELYESAADAMQGFYFLLVLKKNRQNYRAWCDPHTGHLYIVIREILAESTARFPTAELAWGKDGVEKFIGIAQTPGAFHLQVNSGDCCYNFFVACQGKLIHPCTYDTPVLRDQAAKKLREAFLKYQLPPLPEIKLSANGDHYEVSYAGKFVTKLKAPKGSKETTVCYELLFKLLEQVQLDPSYRKDDELKQYVIEDEDDNVLAFLEFGQSPEDWLAAIVALSLRFPLFRKDNGFYFRLPWLSGDGQWNPDKTKKDDCGCDGKMPEEGIDCHTAWIGGCYDTCEEAVREYLKVLEKLQNEKNYRFVFDCSCGKYRIEFIEEADIVATNPQCYTSPEMVCAAVERAKALINDEGIYMVEHILLHPHCVDDCKCLIPNSPDPLCCFTWDPEEEDPCKQSATPVCFVPGADPYSFIATVVLPAWPRRFRDKANRKLMETILYREAPAHVLLRILWLSPKDLCAFETKYKMWTSWLANKKERCGASFDPCNFIQFLFRDPLACWQPDTWCEPCNGDRRTESKCDLDEADPMCTVTINDVFGWETPDCCFDNTRVHVPELLEKDRVKLIRKRSAQYKKQLEEIAANLPTDKVIGQAMSYIAGNSADETKLLAITAKLSEKIAGDLPEKEKAQYGNVQSIVMSFYLDRSLLDEYDPDKLSEVKRVIRKAAIRLPEGDAALKAWNTPELANFVHKKAVLALDSILQLKK